MKDLATFLLKNKYKVIKNFKSVETLYARNFQTEIGHFKIIIFLGAGRIEVHRYNSKYDKTLMFSYKYSYDRLQIVTKVFKKIEK